MGVDTLLRPRLVEHTSTEHATPLRFVCWIDMNMGVLDATDWEMNSPPAVLPTPLYEAEDCRLQGCPALVIPEGQTPRPDGLFSNPLTDP